MIGVVLAFGLGLGVLMIALYPGRAANKFGLLTGSIVSVDSTNLAVLGTVTVVVLAVLAVVYRPLLFASTDPDVAVARGVPVRLLSPLFAVLIALTTALAVPIVGAVIVLAVTVIPGAAAARVTASPVVATLLAVLFAELALVGGTVRVARAGAARERATSRRSRSSATSGAACVGRPSARPDGGAGPPRPAPRPRPRRR